MISIYHNTSITITAWNPSDERSTISTIAFLGIYLSELRMYVSEL